MRGESEQSGRTVLMGVFVRDLDGPLLGFSISLLPNLRAHHAGTVRRDIHARLEVIPDIRRRVKIHGMTEQFLRRVHFQFLGRAFQHNIITLIHQANLGHDAFVAFAHHVGFHRVIFRGRFADENGGALEKRIVERLRKNFVAFEVANFKFKPRANPR